MTIVQSVITVIAVIFGTMITRFLPFLLFPVHKQPPGFIRYLGAALPYAVIGLLMVYCLKDVSILQGSHGMPEAIGILSVVLLHKWKDSMLLSISGGTVIYMLLIQFVFISG